MPSSQCSDYGKKRKSAPDKESIAEILVYHRAEYLLSEELAEQIKAEYAVELSMEEILLLTMFLCYQNEEKTENARPVLIFAFYGVGIASSIAQTVSNMTKPIIFFLMKLPVREPPQRYMGH